MTGAADPAATVAGARKSFGETLVSTAHSSVEEGTVFAVLGPNGSGKTTIVQILSTLIPADADELRMADHDVRSDPDAVRAAIGVTRQFSAVDDPQNLRLMADLEHLCRNAIRARVAVLLERSDLVDAARRPAST